MFLWVWSRKPNLQFGFRASFCILWNQVISCCCCCSVNKLCPILCNPKDSSIPGFPVLYYLWSLLKLMLIDLAMPSNHLILCHSPLLMPSIFPSIRVFSSESVLNIRRPNIRASASTSITPMNIQSWFPLRLIDLISTLSKGLSSVFSSTTIWKHQFFDDMQCHYISVVIFRFFSTLKIISRFTLKKHSIVYHKFWYDVVAWLLKENMWLPILANFL